MLYAFAQLASVRLGKTVHAILVIDVYAVTATYIPATLCSLYLSAIRKWADLSAVFCKWHRGTATRMLLIVCLCVCRTGTALTLWLWHDSCPQMMLLLRTSMPSHQVFHCCHCSLCNISVCSGGAYANCMSSLLLNALTYEM